MQLIGEGRVTALVAALVVLVHVQARAEEPKPERPVGVKATMRVNGYTDNDHNEIVTPQTTVQGQLGAEGQVTVGASVTYDIMSCASVDVMSAATPNGYFTEVRQEYGANAGVKVGTWAFTGSGIYSLENDYSSATGGLGVSTELFQRNTTLALGYGFTGSDVGRAHDPGFSKRLDSHTLTATVTQVLSRSLIAQLTYFLASFTGFQSSPYRLARVASGVSMPENVPEDRLRQAVVGALNFAATTEHFLSFAYRFYGDDWGLMSHTVDLSWSWEVLPRFVVQLRDRIYLQGATDFYQYVYDQPRTYMTNDRELGAFAGDTVGLKASYTTDVGRTQRLALDMKLDFTYQRFSDFDALPTRLLYMGEVGASLDF